MHKRRLDSWKAIAEFLGRSLRTVQRWHELNGLPVHHFGGNKGSVFAYEEEVDAWLAGLAETSGASQGQFGEQLETAKRTSRELTAAAENMWETRSIQSVENITELYHKAIASDSTNSAAYIGLANAILFSAMNDVMDAAIAFPIAMDALRRIPPLDSDSVDAKCPAAWLDLLYNRNWLQARPKFEEVVSRRPSSSFARLGLAMSRAADGRIEEAVECAWEAWRLNPLSRSLGGHLCWFVYLSGDFHGVLDLTSQMRCGGGNGPFICAVEALVLAQDSDLSANLTRLESAAMDQPHNRLLQGILGYAYGIAGEEAKARSKQAQLSHWAESARKNKGYPLALVSLGLQKDQEAISWLEASYAESSLWSLGFRADPILRRLKGKPRFERLLGKIGASNQPPPRIRDSETGVLADRELVEERS
jgi:tetratricopeptide (TPR) repeat protein